MLRLSTFLPVAFLLAILPACVNDPAKVDAISKKDNLPLQTAHDVDMVYTDSAMMKVHLTAPQMDTYGGVNPYKEMVKGVKVEFFDDSGKVSTSLTANYAIKKDRDNIAEAKNDVVVVNNKGEKLNTEHLIWDGAKHRIHTDAFVKITTAEQVIYGTGLDSDESFSDYEIKNITGTFTLKDEPK